MVVQTEVMVVKRLAHHLVQVEMVEAEVQEL
jgi:hypothetical protein